MKEELGFLDILKLLFANKYLMKNKYAWNQPPNFYFIPTPMVGTVAPSELREVWLIN